MDCTFENMEIRNSMITDNIKLYKTYGCPENKTCFYEHWHPYMEFFYVDKGNIALYHNKKQYELKSNDIFIMNSGDIHSGTRSSLETEPIYYYALLVNPSFLSTIKHDMFDIYVKPFIEQKLCYPQFINGDDGILWKKTVRDILKNIIRIIKDDNECNEFSLSICLIALFMEIYRSGKVYPISDVKYDTSTRLKIIYDYINMNYQHQIKIEDIADYVYMGIDNFYKFFKKYTLHTPTEYINMFRIQKACEMLLEFQDKPIINVVFDVGYNNHNYFTQNFKKIIGTTPSQYRKNNCGKKRDYLKIEDYIPKL